MFSLIIFLTFIFCILGVGALAAWSDIKSLTIPNMYSVIILAAFPLCVALMWLFGSLDIFNAWWSHLGALGVVFVVSAAMFHFNLMGAADSKLASAYALWVGLGHVPAFLFIMTFAGAILGAVAIFIRKTKPFKNAKEGGWIAQLQAGGNKVPYGVPIVIGAAFAFHHSGYLSFEALAKAFGI